MVSLSYIVLGAVFSAVIVGAVSLFLLRRKDALHFERLDAQRRADREARAFAIDALSQSHAAEVAKMKRRAEGTRFSLENARVAADMANASNEAYALEVLELKAYVKALKAEREELRAQVAAAPSPRSTRNDTRTIERLQDELQATNETLEAVESQLDKVRSLAEEGQEGTRDHVGYRWTYQLFENIAAAACQ